MLPEYIQWDKDVILQEIQLQAGIRNRAECMDVILWKPLETSGNLWKSSVEVSIKTIVYTGRMYL